MIFYHLSSNAHDKTLNLAQMKENYTYRGNQIRPQTNFSANITPFASIFSFHHSLVAFFH